MVGVALHVLFGGMLASFYLTLDGIVGTIWLIVSTFVDVGTGDPLPPDIAGLVRLTNGLETAVVGAAFGVIGIGLGWLALRVFWRLVAHIGADGHEGSAVILVALAFLIVAPGHLDSRIVSASVPGYKPLAAVRLPVRPVDTGRRLVPRGQHGHAPGDHRQRHPADHHAGPDCPDYVQPPASPGEAPFPLRSVPAGPVPQRCAAVASAAMRGSLMQEHDILLGQPTLASLLRFEGTEHVALHARSGSGKTSGFTIPNCFAWGGSLVVLDIKGEVFAATAGHRAETLRQDVYLLDPASQDGRSHRWDPFASVQRQSRFPGSIRSVRQAYHAVPRGPAW